MKTTGENIMKSSAIKTVGISLLLAAGFALQAQAEPIYVDFSDANGTTAGNWNNSNTTTEDIADLINDSGASTGISLDVTFVNGSGAASAGFGGAFNTGDTGAPSPFDIASVYGDGTFANGFDSTASFTFTGLGESTYYSFTLYGGRDSGWENGDINLVTGTGSNGIVENRTAVDFQFQSTPGGVIEFNLQGRGSNLATPGINALSFSLSLIHI